MGGQLARCQLLVNIVDHGIASAQLCDLLRILDDGLDRLLLVLRRGLTAHEPDQRQCGLGRSGLCADGRFGSKAGIDQILDRARYARKLVTLDQAAA
ncbi:hypothetical protein [Paracoccus lutimaris]|uniref:hypothetical protein n=1 Tax=Paracoccus lutimaris TaxID=1490030 RepID=UPI000DF116A7|nr:hypothetical protein [Paracoccus lutimaris]